jgi:hypothetical protein
MSKAIAETATTKSVRDRARIFDAAARGVTTRVAFPGRTSFHTLRPKNLALASQVVVLMARSPEQL